MKYDKNFILTSIKKLGNKYGIHESFKDIVVCCAYSFANSVDFNEKREKEYLRIINKYSDEEKEFFPKIIVALVNEYSASKEPVDILGEIYENLNLIKKDAAQFFTPLNVCKMMAKVTVDKNYYKRILEEKGYINISDPACGSGRNLYAIYDELLNNGVSKKDILIVGDDLDLICCCMTYIQLTQMGANAIIHRQNTLTMDIYDTFYSVSFAMNKDLQEKNSSNKKEIEEEIEV